jgi:hypothetical protein
MFGFIKIMKSVNKTIYFFHFHVLSIKSQVTVEVKTVEKWLQIPSNYSNLHTEPP